MDKQLIDGIDAYECGRYEEAIELLDIVLKSDKNHWVAWYYTAMSHGYAGNAKRAMHILPLVAAMCPDEKLQERARRGMLAFCTDFYDREQADVRQDDDMPSQTA